MDPADEKLLLLAVAHAQSADAAHLPGHHKGGQLPAGAGDVRVVGP